MIEICAWYKLLKMLNLIEVQQFLLTNSPKNYSLKVLGTNVSNNFRHGIQSVWLPTPEEREDSSDELPRPPRVLSNRRDYYVSQVQPGGRRRGTETLLSVGATEVTIGGKRTRTLF
ncbi:hypothetical protein Trydic_g20931 [Trypoxylus dichotomus]